MVGFLFVFFSFFSGLKYAFQLQGAFEHVAPRKRNDDGEKQEGRAVSSAGSGRYLSPSLPIFSRPRSQRCTPCTRCWKLLAGRGRVRSGMCGRSALLQLVA